MGDCLAQDKDALGAGSSSSSVAPAAPVLAASAATSAASAVPWPCLQQLQCSSVHGVSENVCMCFVWFLEFVCLAIHHVVG